MRIKTKIVFTFFALPTLLFSSFTRAQKVEVIEKEAPSRRIQPAPESVFAMFREAGMNPVNHALTAAQIKKVESAFAVLPPLHQRVLQKHLQSISFMDNMPNTALTSLLDSVGGVKTFNITFRAGLLDETISQWATWKENSCFTVEEDAGYQVRVEAGNMDALIYVLLHEATHVVDVVTGLTTNVAKKEPGAEPAPFTKGIWRAANVPEDQYLDSLLEKTRFRSGRPMPISLAPGVYQKLAKTPFPSLYGMAAWSEDLAELATIYHLTAKLNQPFYIIVTKDDAELAKFEPMKSALVKPRLAQMATFYLP